MNTKRFAIFTAKVIAAHMTIYFLAGTVFYPWLTKPYYVGPNPIFAAFMRTETEPELWAHVVTWFPPGAAFARRAHRRGSLSALRRVKGMVLP